MQRWACKGKGYGAGAAVSRGQANRSHQRQVIRAEFGADFSRDHHRPAAAEDMIDRQPQPVAAHRSMERQCRPGRVESGFADEAGPLPEIALIAAPRRRR